MLWVWMQLECERLCAHTVCGFGSGVKVEEGLVEILGVRIAGEEKILCAAVEGKQRVLGEARGSLCALAVKVAGAVGVPLFEERGVGVMGRLDGWVRDISDEQKMWIVADCRFGGMRGAGNLLW